VDHYGPLRGRCGSSSTKEQLAEVTAATQDEDAVTLGVRGPDDDYRLRARYLVGCDGAHSLVRKQAGIGFPGVTSTEVSRIGRVFLPTATITRGGGEVNVPGVGRLRLMGQVSTPGGVYSLGPLTALDKNAPPGAYIVSTREDDPSADLSAPMTLDELRASVRRVLGADLPMTDPQLLTRIVGNSRQADRYRSGRILIAGDAAHVFGLGGSLNAGLLDAVNLGWKLAAACQGRAPAALLDSYQTERHLAGRHALTQTRAQRALAVLGQGGGRQPGQEGAEALRELFGDALDQPDPLRQPAQLRRIAELTRTARGILLDLTDDAAVAAAASDWAAARLSVITARCLTKPAPAALFIRPDGYVAWAVGPGAADPVAGLDEALRSWLD